MLTAKVDHDGTLKQIHHENRSGLRQIDLVHKSIDGKALPLTVAIARLKNEDKRPAHSSEINTSNHFFDNSHARIRGFNLTIKLQNGRPFVRVTPPEIIHAQFGVKISKSSVCRLLNQLGLSAQKPLWRAWQQNPDKVDKWLKQDFPKIAKRAKKAGGVVWFADEAGLRSDAHSGKTWAVKGETPVVETTGARFGINLISAVNRLGEMRFMCVEGKANADVFIDFLNRLVAGCAKKVFLVVDGHPSHKAKKVKKFLEAKKDQIELFLLPPYPPELNPDEFVWNDLMNNGVGRTAITSPDMLKEPAMNYLRKLQKLPERVASYFKAPSTKYAAV